nr:PREDICTED: uncharacterized protein LOC107078384 isoform X2 [Lepisosteus oculatus]
MTSRLLASFNVLDSCSEKILKKHARSRQLGDTPRKRFTDCLETSYLPLSSESEWVYDLPSTRRTEISKPKSTKEIINEEQRLIHKKISSARTIRPVSALKRAPRLEHSGKPHIRPFTCPEDLAWRAAYWKSKEKNTEEGFMIITIKTSQSLKSGKNTARRIKWSREVEKVPCLDALSKQSSQALVGGTLGYTDTSHWYSFSANTSRAEETPISVFTGEDESQYSIPGSVGKLVAQQLQYGNVVRVGMNGAYRRENSEKDTEREERVQSVKHSAAEVTSEVVPLSMKDELEKKTARILSPKSQDIYLPLPIVSKTYPVVYHHDYQHKPFCSQGLHAFEDKESLHQRAEGRKNDKNEVYSAIVRITQSMQEDHIIGKASQRERMEKLFPLRPETNLKRNKSGKNNANVQVLANDGKNKTCLDFKNVPQGITTHNISALSPRIALNKAPQGLISASKFKNSSNASVGPIQNGVNPKQPLEFNDLSTDFLKGVEMMVKTNSTSGGNQTASVLQKNISAYQESKNYINFTKPLRYNKNETILTNQLSLMEMCQSAHTLLPETFIMSESTGAYEINFLQSRPNSSTEYTGKFQEQCPARKGSPEGNVSPIPSKTDVTEICTEVTNSIGRPSSDPQDENKPDQVPEEEIKPHTKLPSSVDSHQVISIPTAECDIQSVSE